MYALPSLQDVVLSALILGDVRLFLVEVYGFATAYLVRSVHLVVLYQLLHDSVRNSIL